MEALGADISRTEATEAVEEEGARIGSYDWVRARLLVVVVLIGFLSENEEVVVSFFPPVRDGGTNDRTADDDLVIFSSVVGALKTRVRTRRLFDGC